MYHLLIGATQYKASWLPSSKCCPQQDVNKEAVNVGKS